MGVLAGTLRSAVEPRALASAASPFTLVGMLYCLRRRSSRNTIETGGPLWRTILTAPLFLGFLGSKIASGKQVPEPKIQYESKHVPGF